MDLDRGVLARLDRKLLAGLGQDETFHMVRVPVAVLICFENGNSLSITVSTRPELG
jgi:hypothetical protein